MLNTSSSTEWEENSVLSKDVEYSSDSRSSSSWEEGLRADGNDLEDLEVPGALTARRYWSSMEPLTTCTKSNLDSVKL